MWTLSSLLAGTHNLAVEWLHFFSDCNWYMQFNLRRTHAYTIVIVYLLTVVNNFSSGPEVDPDGGNSCTFFVFSLDISVGRFWDNCNRSRFTIRGRPVYKVIVSDRFTAYSYSVYIYYPQANGLLDWFLCTIQAEVMAGDAKHWSNQLTIIILTSERNKFTKELPNMLVNWNQPTTVSRPSLWALIFQHVLTSSLGSMQLRNP